MRTRRREAAFGLAAALALCLLLAPTAGAANRHANFHAVCPTPPQAHGHCYALVVTDKRGNPRASSAPTGLSPQTIRSAYGFPSEGGAGKTIAIVDAYDDPSAESDLSTFSNQFGLPSCGNGCFEKVDQTGGAAYPRKDSGWALEISLDVQWAHAIAPQAHILLVEASSNSFADLLAAEDYAKGHAQYVSNSWGGSEFSGEGSYDGHFSQPGTSFFVAAGDSGLPAEYPSSSPDVVSVGGTTLHFDKAGSFTSETGWSEGGGGCSSFESATTAQRTFAGYAQAGCGGRRATPDVALDADPSSGVAVYDSTKYYGQTGWFKVGGTSASTPMWAGRSAVAGVTVDASYLYGGSIAFRDITQGNNGAPCLVGFDLCSGLGSWLDGSSPPPPTNEEPPVLTTITVSPGEATLFEGESQEFVAHGEDQYGNPVDLSNAEWTTSAPGTLSATAGPTTVFSAGSEVGGGLVTAAVGQVEGSASVTVSEKPSLTAPTGLTASSQGRHISLSWQGNGAAVAYNLYRGISSGGEELYASGLTETSAKDMAVNSGTTYYYYVTAVGPNGEESAHSNEDSATAR